MSVTDSSAAVVMTENRNELPASPSASFDRITVIQPSGRWAAFNFQEIWYYRDLLWALAARDIKLRYKQTALGIFWVVFQPLMAAGLFSIIFGGIAKFPSGAVPYFVFAFAGQLGWQAFQSTLTKASSSLVGNAQLVSKVYFPRLVLPLSTMFSTLIDFGIALALMLLLMLVFQVPVHLSILLLPVWIVLILLLAVGTGLYTGALMVSYRDIQYVLPVLLQFGVYAAPVAFGLNYAIGRFPRDQVVFAGKSAVQFAGRVTLVAGGWTRSLVR